MEKSTRRRQRELASETRAGSWLHRTAVERQYRFLRDNPRVIGIFVLMAFFILPLSLLMPEPLREAWLGATGATLVWLLVLATWQLSGVGYLQSAEVAEQWTVQVLRPIAKSEEWRLINHVLLRPWDIDHVLIGPVGTVVVETKGGATDWTEPRQEPRLQEAARQASRNAADVRRYVRRDMADAPAHAVVALWPARESFATRINDGVTVLSGHRLAEWIETLPKAGVESTHVDAAWTRISKHLERRDADDLRKHGQPPRTINQIVCDLLQYPIGMFLGLAVLAAILRPVPSAFELPACVCTAVASGLAWNRLALLRPLLSGTTAAITGITIVVLGTWVAAAI